MDFPTALPWVYSWACLWVSEKAHRKGLPTVVPWDSPWVSLKAHQRAQRKVFLLASWRARPTDVRKVPPLASV